MMLLLISGLYGHVFAQQGNYFTNVYTPEQYQQDENQTGPQNWGVIQDERGVLYFGNTDRVMTFDGVNWSEVKETEGTHFHKFAKDGSGRIYTGGAGDLGYFAANEVGNEVFVSLKGQLPKEAPDIDKIYNVVADGVGTIYFQDAYTLFLYANETLEAWESETGFGKLFPVGEAVFAQEYGKGIWSIRDGERQLLMADTTFPYLRFKGGLQPDPQKETYWLISRDQGLFEWADGELTPISSSLDGVRVWNVCSLTDGNLAVGTHAQGLWILDDKGSVIQKFEESSGYPVGRSIFPYQDREGRIWVGMGKGIVHLEYPACISHLNEQAGFKGIPTTGGMHDGQLYVGTTEGCFLIESGADAAYMQLVKKKGLEVWAVESFPEGMLVGTGDQGLFWYRKGQMTRIFDFGVSCMFTSTHDAHRVYVARDLEWVQALYFENGVWREEGKPIKFPSNVYRLQEDEVGNLWAGHTQLVRADIAKGLNAKTPIYPLDEAHGAGASHQEFYPFLLKGEIRFGTATGIYQYNEAADRLEMDPAFTEFFPDNDEYAFCPEMDDKGNLWVMHNDITGAFRPLSGGGWTWDGTPFLRKPEAAVWDIFTDPSGKIWSGTTEGMYVFDPAAEPNNSVDFYSLIRSVQINDSLYFKGSFLDGKDRFSTEQPTDQQPVLTAAQRNFRFAFAAPFFDAPGTMQYSYRLTPYEEEWADWSEATTKEYTNLEHGNYRFEVKAKNVYQAESPLGSYAFRILPPWYQTVWAYLLWAILGIAAVFGIVQLSIRRVKQQAEKRRLAEAAHQHALLEAAVDAQEKERKRIAADLHDDIQASLSAANLKLKMLARKTEDEPLLADSVDIVADSIQSVRRISRDLMPASLERRGLESALKELCRKIDGSGALKVVFNPTGEDLSLPPETALGVYRVIQELFANALKHAEATELNLSLSVEGKVLRGSFTDNGKGFDQALIAANGGGLGLRNVESRMSLIHGTLTFKSTIGEGTQVVFSLPI